MSLDYALIRQLRSEVNEELTRRGGLADETLDVPTRREIARDIAGEKLAALAQELTDKNKELLTAEEEEDYEDAVIDALFGMGPLQPLIDNDDIENININGCDRVRIKYRFDPKNPTALLRLPYKESVASTDSELIELIRHAAATLGRTEQAFNLARPQLDMAIEGGHRLSAVMEVTERPAISIRRHTVLEVNEARLSHLEGEEFGALNSELTAFLRAVVLAKKTVIIAGGTNAGKTTLLRAMANEIVPTDRIVTIEKARELGLEKYVDLHHDIVAMETREANTEGHGAITMRELVRRGLRMDPDRVIVGEVLGDEVIDMLNAMSQGNEGSMCTVHSNSSGGVFRRLFTYGIQAPERLSQDAMAALIGGAISFIIFIGQRLNPVSGRSERAVQSIREVDVSGEEAKSPEIFASPASDQLLAVPVGVPECLPDLLRVGLPRSVFAPRRRRQ